MHDIVHRIRVVVGEVEPVTVIDKAVAVVVDTVAVAVRRVPEHVRREVLVVVVDPRVDHTDNDIAASGGDPPRLRRVDVRIGAVVKTPEQAQLGIVGNHEGLDDKVGFHIEHSGHSPVEPDRLFHLQPLRQFDELEAVECSEPLHGRCPHRSMSYCLGRVRDLGREPHEKLVGYILGTRARRGRLTRGASHTGSEDHAEHANESNANGSNSSEPVHFRSLRLMKSESFEPAGRPSLCNRTRWNGRGSTWATMATLCGLSNRQTTLSPPLSRSTLTLEKRTSLSSRAAAQSRRGRPALEAQENRGWYRSKKSE